jgi:hypothetical protein
MRAPRHGGRILVAGFNALGDAFNPVEFMENDSAFQSQYAALEGAFFELTTASVHAEASQIGVSDLPEVMSLPETFVDCCTEAFLAMDNKVPLSTRTNLIVAGMLHWQKAGAGMVGCWRDEIRAQSTYAAPDNKTLALWDIACCLAAEKVGSGDGSNSDYLSLCENSYLNTANCTLSIQKLLAPVLDSIEAGKAQSLTPPFVAVAIQEFPQEGSPKHVAVADFCRIHGMSIVPPVQAPGCAFTKVTCDVGFLMSSVDNSSSSPYTVLTAVQVLAQEEKGCPVDTGGGKEQAQALVAAVHGRLSTRISSSMASLPTVEDLTGDDLKRLTTAIGKTLVLDVTSAGRFISVHAKEMKTLPGNRFLAMYLRSLCHDLYPTSILIDANTPNPAMVSALTSAAEECGLTVLQTASEQAAGSAFTTRKMRSRCHGQLYDETKCMKGA